MKIINYFKSKLKDSNIRKEICIGLINTLLISSIIIIGYSLGSKHQAIWLSLCVTQLGSAIIWLIIRLGAFTTTGYSTRNISRNRMNKVFNKKKTDKKLKRVESPIALEKKLAKKSKAGVYLMFFVGVIYVFITMGILL